MEEAMRE
jgi:hypothetical protein